MENTPEQQEREMELYRTHLHSSNIEMFKSVIEFSKMAVQSAIWINGGAAIALLAFLGQLAKEQPDKIPIIIPAILPFGVGVFLGGVTAGFAYLSQRLYANENSEKAGFSFNVIAIFSGAVSYAAFALGSAQVYCATMRAF